MSIVNVDVYEGRHTCADIDTAIEAVSALSEIISGGTKNLAPNNIVNGQQDRGITATVYGDKSVLLSGTVSGSTDAAFILFPNISVKAGVYVFSGCPSGGATAKYRIDVIVNDSTVYRDTGEGVQFTLPLDSQVRANIAVYHGKEAPSEPFKPMLCTKTDWDMSHAYVPYVPSSEPKVVIEVGADKEYTSLREALEYATAHATNKTIYEVRLFDDEYDVANDITAEELTTSSSYVGLMVTKNVRLVGANNYRKNVIKLELDSSLDSTIRQRISTINVQDNGELENLTVKAKKCRYACHDDFWTETDRTKTIRNCKFYSDDTYYHRAYGAGFRNGDDFVFENCIFEMTDTQAFAPFSAHNNIGFTKPANLKFVNCRFTGGQYGSQFGTLTQNQGGSITTDVVNTLTFIGCKTDTPGANYKSVRLYEESAANYGRGCLMSVTGFANSFTGSDVVIDVTDSQDYSDRIDII